jgi:hypothetical protein
MRRIVEMTMYAVETTKPPTQMVQRPVMTSLSP